MRILQILNPVLPLPPKTMGGAERIVYGLVLELRRRGHAVTVLGENSSQLPADVEFHGIGTYWNQKCAVRAVWQHLLGYGHRYDVIHNHGRLLFYLPMLWGKAAKIHTFHFGDLQVPQVRQFLSLRPRHFAFAPCGTWIADKYGSLGGIWDPVHNGLPIDLYSPKYDVPSDAPFVSIGRMDPRKGIPQAIEVARRTGRRLIVAGVIGDQPHEQQWFETHVLRHCDGEQIQFIGPVNDRQKQELLANAAGLLLPIQGSEALTVVMLEALACGCPVIGFNQYCIPEIVRHGYNGFLVNDLDEMVATVSRVADIDRHNCRRDFEDRFSSFVMTSRYLALYRRIGTDVPS